MRLICTNIFLFFIGGIIFNFALSQDIHFSQYNKTPLLINPAFTGDFNNCYLRLGINYKNQWDKTYITQSAFVDSRIFLKKYEDKDRLGIGGLFFNDKAGDGELTTNYGMALLSLHKSFNSEKTIFGSLGFSFGFGNMSINYSNLYFDNQWNGFVFDPDLPNNEEFSSSSLIYYDLNAGFLLTFIKPDSYRLKIGGSISHIIGQKYSFMGQNITKSKRYLFHADMIYLIDEKFRLSPSVLFSMQNTTMEILAGSNFCILFSDIGLVTGIWLRSINDIIPLIGMEYRKFSLNFSYDINISAQHIATNYNGGLEFSLIKKICYTKDQIHTLETAPCNKW